MCDHLQAAALRDPLPGCFLITGPQTRVRGRLRGAPMRLEVHQARMPQAQVRARLREPQLQAQGRLLRL
jgi:hypothetical protein